jgi:hypothetical protein
MKAPVGSTLAVGFIAVCMIIGLEKMHDTELADTHKDGFAAGYALGQSDIAETMAKKVTDKTCHAWWFGGDTTRAGKSIQKVSLK